MLLSKAVLGCFPCFVCPLQERILVIQATPADAAGAGHFGLMALRVAIN